MKNNNEPYELTEEAASKVVSKIFAHLKEEDTKIEKVLSGPFLRVGFDLDSADPEEDCQIYAVQMMDQKVYVSLEMNGNIIGDDIVVEADEDAIRNAISIKNEEYVVAWGKNPTH